MKLKRIISLVLALCMMISLMPVISATGEAGTGVYVKYSFEGYAEGTTLQSINYENSHERMAFYGESTDTKADIVKAGGDATIEINATSSAYFAFKIKIPKQGKYAVKATYKFVGTGPKMGINILGAGDLKYEARFYGKGRRFIDIDASKNGNTDISKNEYKTITSETVLDTTADSGTYWAGQDEVYLSFTRTGSGDARALWLNSVELCEINPETGEVYETLKPVLSGTEVTIASGVLSLDKETESELMLLNPKMSDGSDAGEGDIPEITYKSEDESVIKIVGSRAAAQSAGEAEVSAYVGDRYLGKSEIYVYEKKPEVEISLPHPYPYLEKGQTVKLNSSATGLTYTSSDNSVAMVDSEGNVSAVGIGKATITAALGSDTSSVEFPVVGTNLLVRKGINHGDFENGVYLTDKSIEGMTNKDSLWSASKGTGNYIYDFELLDAVSHITGEKTKLAQFKVKTAETPEEEGKRTLRMQGGIGQYTGEDNHAGFVVADANKLYELSGFAKAENVDALPDSTYASIYYYNGKYSNATALTEYKGTLWEGKSGEQDWTMFTVPAVYMNWGYGSSYSIDPRFNYSTSSNKGFEISLSHFSVHEVVFDEFFFELDGDASKAKTYDTIPTKTKFLTNTGNEIVLASNASSVPVKYKSTNETVATVDEAGVITARSNGKCTIIAEAEICGVKKTEEITLEFTDLETVLDRLEASVPSEMKLGDSMQLEVKMYNNDESEYTDDNAVLYYESENAAVVSVSRDGVLTANDTGETIVKVYAITGERTVYNSYSVVVSDTTPLDRAEITGSNSVEKNFKITLGVNAWYESGKEVYIPSCTVTYALASDADAEFISVTADGVVSGISEGTGYVTATVTNGDESVTSEPFAVTVTPVEAKSQMIDFRIRDFGTPQDATLEEQRWEINEDKTALGLVGNPSLLKFQSYGIQSQNQSNGNNRNADTAIDIFVEYDGWYEPEFMGGQFASGASVSKLYMDGSYLGSYCFYDESNSTTAGPVVNLNPVYLTRGPHTFILRSYVKGGASYSTNQYPAYLKLNYRSEITVSELELKIDRTSLAVGEGVGISSAAVMSNGSEYVFDLAHGDKKDEKIYLSVESSNTAVLQIIDGRAVAIAPGEAELIATVALTGLAENVVKKEKITVTNEKLSRIEFEESEYKLYKNETKPLAIKAYVKADGSDEREIASENLAVTYDIGQAVCVSLSGTDITGISEGSAPVTAAAVLNGVEQSANATVTVIPDGFETLEIEMFSKVIKLNSKGMQTELHAYLNTGEEIDISRAISISYDYGDGSVITVDNDGVIHPVAKGTATVSATVVIDGTERTASVDVTVRDGKAYSTYYTAEKVANARENMKKYDWARSEAEAVIETADKYVDKYEYVYNLIPSEGIPRGYEVGHLYDPEVKYCRYCGDDLSRTYGSTYPWVSDAMTRPWKVQCPTCKRLFPSNDFGTFYENGLNVHGEFDRTYALEENGILCGRGYRDEKGEYVVYSEYKDNPYGYGDPNGNLYNELYSELYTTNLDPWKKVPITQGWGNFKTGDESGVPSAGYFWGVDDGFGYDTGRVYSNKENEVHTYIAEYIHRGLWKAIGGNGKTSTHVIHEAIESLSMAYVYTGDKRYGRAGAILLDRVADFYPGYSLKQYHSEFHNSHGGGGYGKILGCIWENELASKFSLAYDALFDIYDDSELIAYLSAKAEKYQQTNPKTSGELIRRNAEENILEEVYAAIQRGDISPNFGGMQATAAQVAVILDAGEKSQEIIDYIMRPKGDTDSLNRKTGGDLMPTLMNRISRDGFPTESSLGYNAPWFNKYEKIATVLANYGALSDEDNFLNNPKVIKMGSMAYYMQMADARTANIGDHGGTAGIGYSIGNTDSVKIVFDKTGLPILGQLLYRGNGNSIEGLHMDIFTKDPEAIQDKVIEVIEEYGEIDSSKSTNVTGYGLAALRDGVGFDNVTGTTRDNTLRDWWIYYGGATSHKHNDALNLGLDAFGINMAPDLGYPAQTGEGAGNVRSHWVNGTISHNTVVVNEKTQASVKVAADPLHFDDSGAVKVMDIDAPSAYPDDVDEYRRTLVSVDVDDSVSYAVDFFRIDGGTEHVYSFHSMAYDAKVEGVNLVKQPIGTYAGANIEYGDSTIYKKDSGYNYLKNVSRAMNPGTGTFSADFKVIDYYDLLPDKDWHLKMTMLNDFELSDVSAADGIPPEYGTNPKKLRYILAKRTGKDLDTLFTTVFEPYIGNSAIKSLDRVLVTHTDGSALTEDEKCAAVRVTLNNGRVDYVVYSPDKETAYRVDDLFDFCGFVGVYSLDDEEKPVRTYLLDGTKLDEVTREYGAVTGEVVSFTEGNNFDNYITLKAEQKPSPDELVGKMIDIHNDGEQNGAYMITSARYDGDNLIIGTGDVGYIRSMKDNYDISAGFVHNFEIGDRFDIPVSTNESIAPVISVEDNYTVSAGSSIAIPLSIESERVFELVGTTLPRGMSINKETMTLTWKPDSSQVGDNHVAISADNGVFSDTAHFIVTVYGSTISKPSTDNNASTENSGTAGGGGGGGGGAAPTPDTETTPDDTKNTDETDNNQNDGENSPETSGEADTIRFIDLSNHAWAADAINTLADDGIVKGTTYNTYSPANNITRADFALLLVRAFELSSDNTENFSDVAANDYFAPELAIARNTGIVNGIGDNKYAPRNTITRQDMMVIVYRALQNLNVGLAGSDEPDYEDFDTVADYAKEAVSALISAGLVNGKSGNIAPLDYTTRAEVAVLLKRILDYVK